jgi:hypothetical protein
VQGRAVGARHQVLVVGGDQHRGAQAVQLDEKPQQAQRHGRIDIAGRLVGQQHVGAVDHGAGDGQALLLAARQGGGQGVHAVAQAHPLQQFGDVLAIGVGLAAGDAQRQGGVVEHRQVVQQAEVLEHHPDAAADERQVLGPGQADVAAEQLDAAP